MVVQWSGLCPPLQGGTVSISGWRTKISHASQLDKKKKKSISISKTLNLISCRLTSFCLVLIFLKDLNINAEAEGMVICSIIWVKTQCYKWQKSIQTGSYNGKAQDQVCLQVWPNPHIQTRPAEFISLHLFALLSSVCILGWTLLCLWQRDQKL